MLDIDTEGRASTECDPLTVDASQLTRDRSASHRHLRYVAVYYRLRSMALETHVATLTAELDRKDNRLQETIARYEAILQSRPTADGVVTTPHDD